MWLSSLLATTKIGETRPDYPKVRRKANWFRCVTCPAISFVLLASCHRQHFKGIHRLNFSLDYPTNSLAYRQSFHFVLRTVKNLCWRLYAKWRPCGLGKRRRSCSKTFKQNMNHTIRFLISDVFCLSVFLVPLRLPWDRLSHWMIQTTCIIQVVQVILQI